jgi:integral membrane protein (TIGR01906 family)
VAAVAASAIQMQPSRLWVRAGGALLSLATAVVILGLTMLPFFSSAWIDFEQDRAGSAALTGYAPADVHAATDSIVHDLVFGGAFDVQVAGAPVLDPAEVSHMQDVRGVFGGFAIVALLSLVGMALTAWRGRSTATRAAARAAIRRGGTWLATLLVVLGVIAAVAFDAAFELFHQILFPGGNFDFDPRTEKLVQLFPLQFWSDTVLAYGAVAIVASLLVAWLASGGAAPARGSVGAPHDAGSSS